MMQQKSGAAALSVPPAKLDRQKLAEFRKKLEVAGLDLSKWGINGTKSVEHLFWECYHQRGCVIRCIGVGTRTELKRVTRLVKIHLNAEIDGILHTLYSRMQFLHDGQSIERFQVPLRRLQWKKESEDTMSSVLPALDESYCGELCPHTEDWRAGCRTALAERLGLTLSWQQQNLVEAEDAYEFVMEADVKSQGYPGLNTVYCIHEVTFHVIDPEDSQVQCIGLPQGQEFATTEGDFNFSGHNDIDALAIGTQLNIWTWVRTPNLTPNPRRIPTGRSLLSGDDSSQDMSIKRVPLPPSATTAMAGMQIRIAQKGPHHPSAALYAALQNQHANWDKIRKIAKHIVDESYTLTRFCEDLSDCFPELNLYLLQESPAADANLLDHSQSMSSGRTIGDEYQRTVGAFFAIYWMMRSDLDGKEGFCFGVDEEWIPVDPKKCGKRLLHPMEKRLQFYKGANWKCLRKLLMDANLIIEERRTFGRRAVVKVNETRLVSLLALTAIHDIMKLGLLLPEVQPKDAPYHGYHAGDVIGDHDHALSYLMDHYPDLLPSFRDLSPAEKRSVHFTQCNLSFNHGWFVQAEAPPGAVFTKLREALIRDHKEQIGKQDVALYFVHWLTDLAGAEPTPLGGCEKFVVKFPLQVLNSFLRSIELVQKITDKTETEVMEEYLKVHWMEYEPSPGPLPAGDSAIARMRILCMAQAAAPAFMDAFDKLPNEDREILSIELSRTGTLCQSYSHALVPRDVHESPAGPAFLVYYGPAFLQNLGNDCPIRRLSILAEVYRRARELWPLNVAKAAQNIIIRVDMIKSLTSSELQGAMANGDVWLMLKHNESEAFIERSSQKKLNRLIATGMQIQILDVSNLS